MRDQTAFFRPPHHCKAATYTMIRSSWKHRWWTPTKEHLPAGKRKEDNSAALGRR